MAETESSSQTVAGDSSIPLPALVLGLAGLIPFIASAAALWLGDSVWRFDSGTALIAYGAVILSFLGGIRWGVEITQRPQRPATGALLFSVLPSLLAWGALLVQSLINLPLAVVTLIVGFVLQFLSDRRAARSNILPLWFGKLRLILSVGATLSLLAGLIALML